MTLQSKLTLALLVIGLATAATIGGVAYWLLMANFQESVRESAFRNYQVDLVAYITKYGSFEKADAAEDFTHFVKSRRSLPPPMPDGTEPGPILRGKNAPPPFRFMLADTEGNILRGIGELEKGMRAPEHVMKDGRPVVIDGQVAVIAVPLGEIRLSEQDQSYLDAMRRALLTGVIIAFGLTLIIGPLMGRSMGRTLRRLARAIDAMQVDREREHHVEVKGADEISDLANAFNRMNSELAHAHRDLRQSAETVEQQARELRILNQELEERVASRTADLQTAKEQAELSNRAKTELLANISHELRTPLNAVIGFSEIMRGEMLGPMTETYRSYVDDIHASGTHLLELINDLLDVSAIEAGKLELDEQHGDVGNMLHSALRMLMPRAKEKNLTVDNQVGVDLYHVRVDGRRLKQAFVNLLSNAIKFTPDGGFIQIAAGKTVDGGVMVRITDNGIGMDAQELERAQEMFGQVDGSLGRAQEGMGIGLPLARKMVEMHGGALEITSARNQGTTVTVILPADRVLDSATSPAPGFI